MTCISPRTADTANKHQQQTMQFIRRITTTGEHRASTLSRPFGRYVEHNEPSCTEPIVHVPTKTRHRAARPCHSACLPLQRKNKHRCTPLRWPRPSPHKTNPSPAPTIFFLVHTWATGFAPLPIPLCAAAAPAPTVCCAEPLVVVPPPPAPGPFSGDSYTGGGKNGELHRLPVPLGPPPPVTVTAPGGIGGARSERCWISSFEKRSSSSPSSCKYRQSGFEHGEFRRYVAQYLVVPKFDRICLPSCQNLSADGEGWEGQGFKLHTQEGCDARDTAVRRSAIHLSTSPDVFFFCLGSDEIKPATVQ